MSDERPTYTLEEARALLPEIRATLLQLAVERRRFATALAAIGSADGDGSAASASQRQRHDEAGDAGEVMRALLEHLETRGVQVRDLDIGLVDIPTVRDGELGYWHTTEEGFSSRREL